MPRKLTVYLYFGSDVAPFHRPHTPARSSSSPKNIGDRVAVSAATLRIRDGASFRSCGSRRGRTARRNWIASRIRTRPPALPTTMRRLSTNAPQRAGTSRWNAAMNSRIAQNRMSHRYARVSTDDQVLTSQLTTLKRAGWNRF
jgi:hypothetical protein